MASMDTTAGTRDNVTRAYKPEWANQGLRLDPYMLPQKLNFERARLTRRGVAEVAITLDNKGAVMKRELDCGLPLSLSLPARAFEGVAARAFENTDGSTTVTLELSHSDAELSVPLCVGENVEEIACDWHSWSRALGLPMLMVTETGETHVVKDAGLMVSPKPAARRRRITAMKSRPNFLRRRKTGKVGPVMKLSAQEIIART